MMRANKFLGQINSSAGLVVVVFILAIIPRWLDLGIFVGPDEFTWDKRSANFARAVVSANWDQTYQDGYPGVTLMWAETTGAWLRYHVAWLLGNSTDWDKIIGPSSETMSGLQYKRQVLAIVHSLIVTAACLLVYQIFGREVAWVAGFLLAFDPFFLTESRVLRSEGIMTGFTTLALLAMSLYLYHRHIWVCVLTGVLTGLALLSKISTAPLVLVGILVMAGAALLSKKDDRSVHRWRITVIALSVWASVTVLTVFALWPALWVNPVEVMVKTYNYASVRATEGNEGGVSFFMGMPRTHEELGPWFYPVVLLFRASPFTWLGLVLWGIMIWPVRRLSRSSLVLMIPILFYCVIYIVLIASTNLKYDRFIIPFLPSLNILAALGLVTAWHCWAEYRRPFQAWGWLFALSILLGQFALTWPHHPYYYTYWNPLLGGAKQAVKVLPVGVGLEGVDQVVAYLNTLPGADNLALASAVSQKIHPIFNGQTIPLDNLDGKWTQADYVLIYISQLQRSKHAEDILAYLARHKPEYILVLHGLEYAWLYPGPAAQHYGGGHKLEGRGTLFGYSLGSAKLTAGASLPVKLYWRNEGQQQADLFFVRLVDADGYVWAEAIAQPQPGFEEASRRENSIVESEAVLTLPAGMPPGDYFFKSGFRTTHGSLIGYFELPPNTKPIQVTTARSYPALDTFQPPYPARLTANGDLALLGYQLNNTTTRPGAAVWLTLFWQATTAVGHDYVILVRLLDKTGQELSYWLGRPVRSGYPTTEWQAGQTVQDPWQLTIPAAAQPGDYQMEIAIFDAATQNEVIRQKIGFLTINSK